MHSNKMPVSNWDKYVVFCTVTGPGVSGNLRSLITVSNHEFILVIRPRLEDKYRLLPREACNISFVA